MFIEAFGFRAAHMIALLVKKRDIERRSWNSLLTEIFRASTAHAQFVLVWNFGNAILKDDGLQKAPALQRVMQQCFDLFGMCDVPRLSEYTADWHHVHSLLHHGYRGC
jgi:acyl-CoA oxidase